MARQADELASPRRRDYHGLKKNALCFYYEEYSLKSLSLEASGLEEISDFVELINDTLHMDATPPSSLTPSCRVPPPAQARRPPPRAEYAVHHTWRAERLARRGIRRHFTTNAPRPGIAWALSGSQGCRRRAPCRCAAPHHADSPA